MSKTFDSPFKTLLIFSKNRGLVLWSEQADESIHRKFLKYWNRYKINNVRDQSYDIQLKKTVVDFLSKFNYIENNAY